MRTFKLDAFIEPINRGCSGTSSIPSVEGTRITSKAGRRYKLGRSRKPETEWPLVTIYGKETTHVSRGFLPLHDLLLCFFLLFPPCPPHLNPPPTPLDFLSGSSFTFLGANRTSSLPWSPILGPKKSSLNSLNFSPSSDLLEFHFSSQKNKKIRRRNLLLSVNLM